MNNVLVDIREYGYWIRDRFKNKDYITLEELINDYEDVLCEIENLQKEKREEPSEFDEHTAWQDQQLEKEF